MSKEFILKFDSAGVEGVRSKIIHELAVRFGTREDCKVIIQPLEARSKGQLQAYWCLVKAIKEWMLKEGNFYLRDEHNLIYNVSNKDSLSDYIKIQAGHYNKNRVAVLTLTKDIYQPWNQYIIEPKSIANNSDCTREDMKKIIDWILNFAADMVIPECKIKDTELENMLESYDNR